MPLWSRLLRRYGCGSRGSRLSHLEDFEMLQYNAGEAIRGLLKTSRCRSKTDGGC